MRSREDCRPTENKVKILIVDDHPIVRQGLRLLIDGEADLAVCGEAEDAHGALEIIDSSRPNLAIIDICLKGADGLDLIKDIRVRYPELPVLVLSMYPESLYAERTLRAGARGYVAKEQGTENLIAAIRRILAGDIYVSQEMSSRMLGEFIDGRNHVNESSLSCLTDRELEVFRLIGQGRETRQIADQLHLSVKTIETHRAHIKKKLNLKTPAELVQHAVLWVQRGQIG